MSLSLPQKNICIGVLAHVDAGKTTLSEAILYKTGQIKTPGRVDNGNAFLDTERIEKKRGITVFSKQAIFPLGDKTVFLQDTPGHVDFSAEMERTLSVLDYAVLVISAPDGIQSHTELLLELLEKHSIPTFVFINKTDLEYEEFRMPETWVDLSCPDPEGIALCSEYAMDEYERTGSVSDITVKRLVRERKLMPVFRGSALRLEGIDAFLEGLDRYTEAAAHPEEFGARCFKITRDEKENRLSWLKITGGSLKLRETVGDEKITGIRLYSGGKFDAAEAVYPGSVCAVLGLENSFAGQGLGFEEDQIETSLEPVLTYRIKVLDGTDDIEALRKLSILAEEDPLLKIEWDENLREIHARLMGSVQIEVLSQIISDRLGMEVSIEEGKVVYKETIGNSVEGVGHFEPLRHYAEVHLLMEPLSPGSGIVLETACSEDLLDRNWQRLILYNLAEYRHVGVLTGSPLTDVKMTLIAGRAHLKHTEGGDFRQASLRAVRQGLMKAENVLLEPFYRFRIEIPSEQIGRLISDLKAMGADFEAPEQGPERTVLSGIGPVSELQNYQTQLLSYTRGKGKLSCRYEGYFPCHDTEKVIGNIGYDPDRDTDNPSSSVFCSHGSGVNVRWDSVEEFEHIDSGLSFGGEAPAAADPKLRPGNFDFDEKELEEIMEREFGKIKRPRYSTVVYEPLSGYKAKIKDAKKEYLVVDGYNIVFAWDSLKKLAADDISAARESLMDILAEYRSVKGCEMVIVFDGYKLKGNEGSRFDHKGINIVYTKEGQSADAYIESLVKDLGHSYSISVATSDALVQLSALRQGTRRISARELEMDVKAEKTRIEEIIAGYSTGSSKLGERAKITSIH
ncbi:MAG: TetM/TetW/TetO/TetS family tetracycline resistance ribosomal protection protein [Firmicutes bacterium]|nr:TetM/TetW/TetO/TetS family tetracycline resistance ribosomal protection protein [Bacillota bacterium]